MTPYDWQEGIGHRAQYVEGRLKSGIPVAAVSVTDGILVASYRYTSGKIFEVYDRLVYSAIGLQSDVEALRVAAVEYCHQEGYRRSEEDVTIQRVVTTLSDPLKKAFGDFRMSPMVVRTLFAEVGENMDKDRYYVLDYDGDFRPSRGRALLAGSDAAVEAMAEALKGVDFSTVGVTDALAQLREAVLKGMDPDGESAASGELPELTFEAVLMRRDDKHTRKFEVLEGQEIDGA